MLIFKILNGVICVLNVAMYPALVLNLPFAALLIPTKKEPRYGNKKGNKETRAKLLAVEMKTAKVCIWPKLRSHELRVLRSLRHCRVYRVHSLFKKQIYRTQIDFSRILKFTLTLRSQYPNVNSP